MKIRTPAMLQTELDTEFGWRVKELADLRLYLKSAHVPNAFIRAAVPLAYAHWEGGVKQCTILYINFVDTQGLRYDQLAPCFVALGLRKRLSEFSSTNKARLQIAAVQLMSTGMADKASLRFPKNVSTESNLKSEVFDNIARTVGIDTAAYETKYNFMDERLLGRRNSIAHGDYLSLDREQTRDLIEEVIVLLRMYKNDLSNAATSGAFRRP